MNVETRGHTPDGKLDPQIERMLRLVAEQTAGAAKPLAETSADEVRSAPDPIESIGIAVEPVYDVLNMTVSHTGRPGIPIRIYRPAASIPLPVLVFLHGGCWVFCDLDTHDNLCRYFCNQSQCLVVSVDYRRAPENRFPAGLDDAHAIVGWLAEHAAELGGDPARMAVGGDSAGGNLAAAVALMDRDRGEYRVGYQLLIYPILDISSFTTVSYQAYHTGYFLTQEMMEWASNLYVSHHSERENPYVSPLLAQDLTRLPPAFIVTAEADILRDEGEAYAHRLAAAGNKVRCVRYKGMVHAFVAMAGDVGMGRVALQDCAASLSEWFYEQFDYRC